MISNIDYEEKISFSQVYDIVMFLDEETRSKIPVKFIEFIKANKSDNYISTINPYIPLESQKLNNQTKAIISYIYIKYLSTEDEKKAFKEKERLEYEKDQKEIEDRYKNIFNTKNKSKPILENKLPVLNKKYTIFDKIKDLVKGIFKKSNN